jgi:hypothetical protein
VLRPAKGKDRAWLLDLQGISHVHGVPEDDRAYSLAGKAIRVTTSLCRVCKAPWVEAPCPKCGYAPEAGDGPDTGETTITNEPLVRFARKLAEGPEQRRETMGRWLVALALKDENPGQLIHKWKAVYGIELSREWYFRGLADCTHSENEIVAEWAKRHLQRIQDKRRRAA